MTNNWNNEVIRHSRNSCEQKAWFFLDWSVISRPHPFAFHMLFLRGAANQKNAGLLGDWINVDDWVIPLPPLKSS